MYGFFVIDDKLDFCAYVGRSEQLYTRVNEHIERIESGTRCSRMLNRDYVDRKQIEARLLESVSNEFDNYYKDDQRLASAENKWIYKYQNMNQCLEQVPEGRSPNIDRWEKLREEHIKE